MAKHNIRDLMKEWVAIQSKRAEKMRLNNIRIKCAQQSYYARVQVNNEFVIIRPVDDQIPSTTFDENHLEGCSEYDQNGIVLRQRFGRPPMYLFCRTENQRRRILARLRILMGDETTTESSSGSEIIP